MKVSHIHHSHYARGAAHYATNSGAPSGSIEFVPANEEQGRIAATWLASPASPSNPVFERVSFFSMEAAEYFLLSQSIENEAAERI